MSSRKSVDRNDSQQETTRVAIAIARILADDAWRRRGMRYQADMAREMGYRPESFSNVKGGRVPLAMKLARAMEAHFGVSADWLMGGDVPMWVSKEEPAGYEVPVVHADSGDMRVPIERKVYDCRRCLGEVKKGASTCQHCGQELLWPAI